MKTDIVMKRKLFIGALAALVLSWSASAQVEWGLRGGVSANWIPKTFVLSPISNVRPCPAFYGGVTANIDVSSNFIIHSELIYSGKGHSAENYIEDYMINSREMPGPGVTFKDRYRLHYLQLPVLFGARLADERCYVALGPELGYLFAAKNKTIIAPDNGTKQTVTTDIKESCKPFNLGVAVQAGYLFTDNLGLDLKFEWGVTKTFNNLYSLGNSKGHNTSVSIGLFYVFE